MEVRKMQTEAPVDGPPEKGQEVEMEVKAEVTG